MAAFVDRDARGLYSINDLGIQEFAALANAMTRLDGRDFERLEPVCRQMLELMRQANAELDEGLRRAEELLKQYKNGKTAKTRA